VTAEECAEACVFPIGHRVYSAATP
jgi:hypothetical protein